MLADAGSPVTAPNLYPSTIPGDPTGTILRGTEQPYGVEPFGLAISAGYRFLPWLSVGASFTYASFDALDGTDTGDFVDGTSQLQRQLWSLSVYARYYFTQFHSHLHPWVQVGLGYSDDNASYVRGSSQSTQAQPETAAYYLEVRGLAIPLSLGLDWRLAPVFSVGPWVGYERIVPLTACVEVDVDSSASFAPTPNTCGGQAQGHGYGVVSGGIGAKITIDPWAH
jgi:hypothetical protein